MSTTFWRTLYSWFLSPLLRGMAHGIAVFNTNLRAGLQGRKGVWQRLEAQVARRNPEKSLIWFHVASAGEFLQAQPVFERFVQDGDDCAVTFSSVNGYKWARRARFEEGLQPLIQEYLPLDSVGNMRRMLRLLRPAAIVYVKYDLWPNLVWEAHDAGIPQFLISATLQPHSARVTLGLARSFYHTLYSCLDGIFVMSEDDHQRFWAANPDHPHIEVVGSTGFDIVLDRKKRLKPPALPEGMNDKCVFIAGSTWPQDEECIFPALKEALDRYPDMMAIIAPHEPADKHLTHSESAFSHLEVERFTTLQETGGRMPQVLVVDTIGVLSSLYALGNVAYVGGAFTTGVHNVIEPAVMGLPVIFGPKHHNSPEALELLERGCAFAINDPEEFRAHLFRFLEHPEQAERIGEHAIQSIESRAGVAERCFQLIKNEMARRIY